MDYEKKYNNALDRARLAIKDCGYNQGRKEMIYGIFPELKGNEDENIRRGLMALICNWNYPQELFAPITKILAWLEKQKDVEAEIEKAYKNADAIQYEKGFEDGVASVKSYMKPKEHDMPSSTELIAKWNEEKKILQEKYEPGHPWRLAYNAFMDGFGYGFHVNQKANHKGLHKGSLRHVDNPTKWMKEDDMEREQKQYDIDVLERHITKDSVSALAHTVIVRNGWEIVEANEHKPAEWSDDFEENIRILLHDKLTWRSEDGTMSSTVFIDNKTLKDIISGIWFYVGKEALKYPNKELSQPEWSEEDEKMKQRILTHLYSFISPNSLYAEDASECISWLKSLRPQHK